MSDQFLDVRILDNFYQTSSFFPMPVVLMSTFAESGKTNLGPYSLCFPHIVTKQGDHAMMLICRATSNTARNIVRTKVCAINFIPDQKRYLKNCVMLGFPGETTEEKMKHSIFTLLPGTGYGAPPARAGQASYPEIVEEAIQVFLCTWDESYPLQHNEFETYYFLLRIDRIIMKKKWRDRCSGARDCPPSPSTMATGTMYASGLPNTGAPMRCPSPKAREIPSRRYGMPATVLIPTSDGSRKPAPRLSRCHAYS